MPPVSRSDTPYPLRTIDGEVDVVADEIFAGELVVTGLSTFQDIYVAGTANITGGTIDLSNITANSLDVINDTDLNILDVSGLSTLAGVNAQAISSTGVTVTGNITIPTLSGGIVSAPFIRSDNFTIGHALKVSDVNNTIVSYANTGTGDNVRKVSPQLTTPDIGAATGASLQLSGLTASQSVQTDGSKNLVSLANTGTGNNVLQTSPSLVTPILGAASGTSLNLSSLTASQSVQTDGSKNLVSLANTGSGLNVLQTSPSLVTPVLGAASGTSLSLTSLTIGDALKVSDIDQSIVSYANTGTGNNVRQTSPSLITPVLGAASGTSLSLSGLTASQSVQTDGSKNLVSVANTGSGLNVLQTSPSLVTPILGAASGTSLNLSGLTASQSVQTDVSKNLVSVANTGSGNNVLQTSPSLITPALGDASGTSLSLTTPLPATSGGTGQTSLALVQVGTASVAVNLSAGLTGQVPYQTGVSTTGFIPLQTAGTILTSNGVGVQPTFQTPAVGTVSGVLPVANGGTGVTTSTGSGSVVLSNSPSLVTPNIGVASGTSLGVSGTLSTTNNTNGTSASSGAIFASSGGIGCASDIWGGARVIANSGANANSASTGAISAPTGGIGCASDIWGGARVLADSSANATSASTGAFSSANGGVGCARDAWIGGRVTSNSSANATNSSDGAINTPGGVSCAQDMYAGGTSRASTHSGTNCEHTNVYCSNVYFPINNLENPDANVLYGSRRGEFTPQLRYNDFTGGAVVGVTYTRQRGWIQQTNQFLFFQVELEWDQTDNTLRPYGIGGFSLFTGPASPAITLGRGSDMTFSYRSNLPAQTLLDDQRPYFASYDPDTNPTANIQFGFFYYKQDVGYQIVDTLKLPAPGNGYKIYFSGVQLIYEF